MPMEKLVNFWRHCQGVYPNKIIVAGNGSYKRNYRRTYLKRWYEYSKVSIAQVQRALHDLKLGVGMPQLSAIMECADAAHGVNGLISDGGVTCPGDMTKGFGGGADFIMIGGQFYGTL